jgi:hypothetical protein
VCCRWTNSRLHQLQDRLQDSKPPRRRRHQAWWGWSGHGGWRRWPERRWGFRGWGVPRAWSLAGGGPPSCAAERWLRRRCPQAGSGGGRRGRGGWASCIRRTWGGWGAIDGRWGAATREPRARATDGEPTGISRVFLDGPYTIELIDGPHISQPNKFHVLYRGANKWYHIG